VVSFILSASLDVVPVEGSVEGVGGAGNPVASVVPAPPGESVVPGIAELSGIEYERGALMSVSGRGGGVTGAGAGGGWGVVVIISDVVVLVVIAGDCAGFCSPPQAATASVHTNAIETFFISTSSCCGACSNGRARLRESEREQTNERRRR